ncbi:MAG: HNH endonuclease [Chloroflexota bacterium]
MINQEDSLYPHEVDHIIPEKHRGATTLENLCLACLDCPSSGRTLPRKSRLRY